MIPAYEARLAADAYHVVNAANRKLAKIAEEIKQAAAKGHYTLAFAEMPKELWEKLREQGYTVTHLLDGYEVGWGHIDMNGGDNVG